MKKQILLFQLFLRVHILNFALGLKKFEYIQEKPPQYGSAKTFYSKQAGSAEKEFGRNKITYKVRLRRALGILNVRPKFTDKGDVLFTYGCLLVTNKPYCTYIENGVTLFNYDAAIARNPIARLLLAGLVRLPQCKKLIFMSQTAYTSFLATAKPGPGTRRVIERKAAQIYPLVADPKNVATKHYTGKLRLLFTGVFYMKGGIEILNAFDRLRADFPSVELTVITPLLQLRAKDKRRLKKTPGVTLQDAVLTKDQMEQQYREHDIFLFPTFRDTFGLVLIEAMALGLPAIAVDQYAVGEMVKDGGNGFLLNDHPLTDYNRQTLEMYGRLYNARDFYQALFSAQESGRMRPVEDFLVNSVSRYYLQPRLLATHSKKALELYKKTFSQAIISQKIEAVFDGAVANS